jgi:hypothetical protein
MQSRGFPERIGRYEILAPIARGGTASVYLAASVARLAEDPPLVALKLPLAHLTEGRDAAAAAELVEEAKLAARVVHPNVVRTFDVGVDAAGLFLVMEYIEGDSLARILRAASDVGLALPLPLVRRLLDDALAGLEAAHAAVDASGRNLGIVHRDFSPQNVLVGADGVARLGDFGIARAATRAQFTQTGIVKGKAAYMSPEQAQGFELDQRSDVWSAAVLVWEMLAGRPLYPADDALATMLRIVRDTPPRVAALRPDLPAEVDALVASALAPEPSARCPSVSVLRQGLRASFGGPETLATRAEVGALVTRLCAAGIDERRREAETVLAQRRRDTETAQRRRRRRRWVGGAAAMAGLGLVVGGVLGLRVWIRSRAPAPAGTSRAGASVPKVLATAQAFPRALAIDGAMVYWSSRDGIFRTHKNGAWWFGQVAAGKDARGLAVDGAHVYFAEFEGGRVSRSKKPPQRHPIDGEPVPPSEPVAEVAEPEGVALDETHVYFTSGQSGQVLRLAKADVGAGLDVAPTVVAQLPEAPAGRRMVGLVADGDLLYFTDAGLRTVNRVARGGGEITRLATTGPEPYHLAVDAVNVYWRDGTLVDGRVMSVPKAGGAARVLVAKGESFPRGIAVDRRGVYWTAGNPKNGRIARIAPDGTGRVTLVDQQIGVHGIATDGEAVYYTAWGGGAVWKLLPPPAR